MSRQPLALLPGLLLTGRLWDAQREALADIADIWLADFTTQDSVTRMAEDVLAAMPPTFALAGLSMGGYVAQEIVRLAPGRVTRLALLDTKARPDDSDTAARRRGLMDLARRGQFKGVTPRLLPLLLHPDRLDDGPLRDAVMQMAEEVGLDAFLRQQQAILDRPDYRPLLARIGCPTLVLCGDRDQLTPPEVHRELAAGIRSARLVVVEGAGHLPPLERPADTSTALRRWLLTDEG